jgi:hypothetical protein
MIFQEYFIDPRQKTFLNTLRRLTMSISIASKLRSPHIEKASLRQSFIREFALGELGYSVKA